jgi:putative DNA primase/helicase
MKPHQKEIKDLALGRWPLILEQLQVLDEDQLKSARHEVGCPACGGKTRFRFDDKEGRGTFYCSHCGPGDGFQLVMNVKGWSFAETAKEIREIFEGAEPVKLQSIAKPGKPPETDEAKKARVQAKLLRTLKASKRVTAGDPVWKYLVQTRKFPLTHIPSCIRYHPGLKYFDEDMKDLGTYPVMLTVVQGPDAKMVGLHRTYLTSDGQKAPVPSPKKLMETCGLQDGAIRLAKHGKKLAIAEGIETGFGVMFITKMPCWVTVSASLMPSVQIPEDVDEIHIFGDNDLPDKKGRRAGQEGAMALDARLKSEGRTVRGKVFPINPGTDFDDVYQERMEREAQRAERRKRPAKKAVAVA